MAFDAQGNHSLPSGTIVNTGDKVLPSQHNPAMQDISASLSSVLVRDGRAGMVGTLSMGGFGITNLKDGAGNSDAATVGQIGSTFGSQVGAATSKATPVDADYLPIYDSAASNALRKLTWANLKAALKTYFDTIYPAISATVLKAGSVMTGKLTLDGNPTDPLHAVPKQYVDANAPNYGLGNASLAAGVVGQFGFMTYNGSNGLSYGDEVQGSTLRPANAQAPGSGSQTGRWRCLGQTQSGGDNNDRTTTLFIRIE